MAYKTDKINSEITINNRIIPREYLTEISKYSEQFINLTENSTNNKHTLEKKLIKK